MIEERTDVEDGQEKGLNQSWEQIGEGAGQAGAGIKKGKKDDKKGKKGKKAAPKKKIEGKEKEDEESDGEKELESERWIKQKQIVEAKSTRSHINCFWWLKFKLEIGRIMVKQNKFKIANKFIRNFKKECEEFKNQLFIRDLIGLQARIHVRTGYIDQALIKFKESIEKSQEYHLDDKELAILLGDYGEILMDMKEHQLAQKQFLLSKNIFKKLLDEFNFQKDPPNFNDRIAPDNLQLYKEFMWTTDEDRQITQAVDKVQLEKKHKKKGGKDEKKKKDMIMKKKVEVIDEAIPLDILPLNPVETTDYFRVIASIESTTIEPGTHN